jgi:Fe-S-cluster containining protein
MTKLGDVPCGPCRACCRSELIALLAEEGDDIASYDHEMVFINGFGDFPFLKHKKNGECVYLGRDGCTIHARRPHICRFFDCRGFYLSKTRAERLEHRKEGATARAVLTAGHARVKTLDFGELRKVPTK